MKNTWVTLRVKFLLTLMLISNCVWLKAQDKVTTSLGADIVSTYYWRGTKVDGASIQPELDFSYKNFTLSAWGNIGLEKDGIEEIDLSLGYEKNGFSISVIDYWTKNDFDFFKFKAHSTGHVFAAQLGYDFGPAAINWFTNFAGNDGVNKNDNRAYSSYISVSAPFTLGGIDFKAEVGATPWSTDYYDDSMGGFTFCEVALTASKELKITKSFNLPLRTTFAWNPENGNAFCVFGISL